MNIEEVLAEVVAAVRRDSSPKGWILAIVAERGSLGRGRGYGYEERRM